MNKLMNKLLADLVVEYHKLQHFHWYVKGGDFFTAHAKLEEYYDEINEAIDEVAEAMLMCKADPASTMKEFLELAEIKEPAAGYVTSDVVFDAVTEDFTYLLESVKAVKAAAEKEDCDLVANKMDGYIDFFSKALWMIRQTMMK